MLARLAWTEIKLSLRKPSVAVFALAFPLILLYLLLESFGAQPDAEFGGRSATDYYVPAYIAGTIAAIGLITIPVHLAAYRERGVLQRLRASGVRPTFVLMAQTLVAFPVVAAAAVVMVALGRASFELSAPSSWLAVVGGLGLATLTFCALGVALASLLPTARSAQAIGLLAFFGMFFISGGGPPAGILPDGVTRIADALPLAYAIDVLQRAWWTGGWDVSGAGVQVAVLAGAAGISIRRLRYV